MLLKELHLIPGGADNILYIRALTGGTWADWQTLGIVGSYYSATPRAVLPRVVSVSHLRSPMGYDEPETLSYSIAQICLTGADVRQEILNAEWFFTTRQAQIVINQWLRQYNHIRPHQALGMRAPVPETI